MTTDDRPAAALDIMERERAYRAAQSAADELTVQLTIVLETEEPTGNPPMPNLRDLTPGDSVVVTSGNSEPELRTVEVVSRDWIDASDGAQYSRFTGLRRDGCGTMWHNRQEWENQHTFEAAWKRFREAVARQVTIPPNVSRTDLERAMIDLRLNLTLKDG